MTTRDGASISDALISSTLSMSFECLPRPVVDRAKELLLDHLGVSLYGATLEWCRMVRETVEEEGGRPVSSIYGGGMATARGAALANGTAGHAIELDDAHDESLSHPGCVVIPASLALGEETGACGRDVLAAIVAGYDVQGRLGAAISSRLIKKGFHPTAQLGVFGAAAASARLLGLSHQETTWAFGLAGSMASGIMKFTQDPEGTMVKRLHGGLPAERGILAAKLARRGLTGPRDVIEGEYGYARTLTDADGLARAERGLGETYEISSVSLKLYPCCRMFHALIEAIAGCRNDPRFSPERVRRIETLGPDNMIDGHLEYRPLSTMSAQYSLPYTAAVAVLGDVAQPDSFEEPTRSRRDVLEMADRVEGRIDRELQALYPRKYAGRVRFHLEDGEVMERTVLDSRSTPANPITRDDVVAKFRSTTSAIMSSERQDGIIRSIADLEDAPDLSRLVALLRSR